MRYDQAQIGRILQKIIAKAQYELQMTAENDTVEEVMEEYGVTLEEEAMPVSRRTSKILVIGSLSGKANDYQAAAKQLGIMPDNLEFVSDYSKMHNFNTATLRNSLKYSDIIYGSAPHKMKNMGDVTSPLTEMKNEPQYYPRVTECVANEKLKITITNFRGALRKTRYLESQFA